MYKQLAINTLFVLNTSSMAFFSSDDIYKLCKMWSPIRSFVLKAALAMQRNLVCAYQAIRMAYDIFEIEHLAIPSTLQRSVVQGPGHVQFCMRVSPPKKAAKAAMGLRWQLNAHFCNEEDLLGLRKRPMVLTARQRRLLEPQRSAAGAAMPWLQRDLHQSPLRCAMPSRLEDGCGPSWACRVLEPPSKIWLPAEASRR